MSLSMANRMWSTPNMTSRVPNIASSSANTTWSMANVTSI